MTLRALNYLNDLTEELKWEFFVTLIREDEDDIQFEVVTPDGRHSTWWGTMKTPVDTLAWQIRDTTNGKTPATN